MEAINLVVIFGLLTYMGKGKIQKKIKLTLTLTLLLTLTQNPQSKRSIFRIFFLFIILLCVPRVRFSF